MVSDQAVVGVRHEGLGQRVCWPYRRRGGRARITYRHLWGTQKLRNVIKNLYSATEKPDRIGTGTTADAVRYEIATGQPVKGRWHLEKAETSARGLRNWLRRNPSADPHDRLVAQSLYDELIETLRHR
jgi:hypothetical protein